MKKALLIVLGIITLGFLLGNADTISKIFSTARQGATIPLIVSLIVMLARHVTQAVSYQAAFEAVGYVGRRLWDYVVLIFSLVFINTFCLFSGATGVAFIIDDAHRHGADIGKATSGAVLSQIGYFAAIFVISIIGFTTMIISGNVNWVFVTGAVLLAGTLIVLSSMYLVGFFKPAWLYALFAKLQKPIGMAGKLIKRPLKETWSNDTAESFITAARVMASNPAGTAISVGWASLSAILNMSSLVAIGYAFGFGHVSALVAAFALAAISVILSPTPQGIGVVEAAIAAVLTANGSSLATATAIALVYRGIMFWVPFCIGAVLLSQSGFFQSKKDASQQQKDKDTAWITGTLVGIIGVVNIGVTIVPAFFSPYGQLVEWVDFHAVFAGPSILFFGVLLLIMAVGLVRRYRLAWALTTTLLMLLAGVEFLFYQTVPVAIMSVVLGIWLLVNHSTFDQPLVAVDTKIGRKVLEFLQGEEATQAAKAAKAASGIVEEEDEESSAQVAANIIKDGRGRLTAFEIASEIEEREAAKGGAASTAPKASEEADAEDDAADEPPADEQAAEDAEVAEAAADDAEAMDEPPTVADAAPDDADAAADDADAAPDDADSSVGEGNEKLTDATDEESVEEPVVS